MKNLETALNELQSKTIGFFKHKYANKNDIELVIENDNNLLVTISIDRLAGYITNHIPASEGKLFMFEGGKNLFEIKQNPYKLDEIITEFDKL